MNTLWKAIVGVILIYIFGVLSGIAGTSIYAHHKIRAILRHPALTLMRGMETRLTEGLHLDNNQKEKIHQCFMENLKSRAELEVHIQPQIRLLNLETVREISATLRPDQLERFHENLDDLRRRMAANGLNPAESLPGSSGGGQINSTTIAPPGP